MNDLNSIVIDGMLESGSMSFSTKSGKPRYFFAIISRSGKGTTRYKIEYNNTVAILNTLDAILKKQTPIRIIGKLKQENSETIIKADFIKLLNEFKCVVSEEKQESKETQPIHAEKEVSYQAMLEQIEKSIALAEAFLLKDRTGISSEVAQEWISRLNFNRETKALIQRRISLEKDNGYR